MFAAKYINFSCTTDLMLPVEKIYIYSNTKDIELYIPAVGEMFAQTFVAFDTQERLTSGY